MSSNVTVYSTSTCPYCDMMKNFLKEQGVPFKEVNVQQDPEAGQKLVETTGQIGVPQTEVNGEWVLGYDPNKLMELIKK